MILLAESSKHVFEHLWNTNFPIRKITWLIIQFARVLPTSHSIVLKLLSLSIPYPSRVTLPYFATAMTLPVLVLSCTSVFDVLSSDSAVWKRWARLQGKNSRYRTPMHSTPTVLLYSTPISGQIGNISGQEWNMIIKCAACNKVCTKHATWTKQER